MVVFPVFRIALQRWLRSMLRRLWLVTVEVTRPDEIRVFHHSHFVLSMIFSVPALCLALLNMSSESKWQATKISIIIWYSMNCLQFSLRQMCISVSGSTLSCTLTVCISRTSPMFLTNNSLSHMFADLYFICLVQYILAEHTVAK